MKVVDRLAYSATIPAAALMAANAIFWFVVTPRGPFGQGEERMRLLGNSLNYLLGSVFQVVLVVFLLAVAYFVRLSFKAAQINVYSRVLTVALLSIYLLSIVCAVLLFRGFPNFLPLISVGLLIVILSWIALVSAYQMSRRAIDWESAPRVPQEQAA